MADKTKGIILAGGSGTRLYPLTLAASKQLLPVYDKPLIYYSLSILMLAGIKDILIITTLDDIDSFKMLLQDGSQLGINLSYKIQPKPNGLAEAFIIGEEFISDDNAAMILGDNIFYGNKLSSILKEAVNQKDGAAVFAYSVNEPKRFGIVNFDDKGKVLSIEEKPDNPKSNYAVTGLYFYDNKVVDYAKRLKKSSRGELEITDLNNIYLKEDKLSVKILGRGYAWFDAGTADALLEAAQFVKTVEHRQGINISAPEEIAYRNNWINSQQLSKSIEKYKNSQYGKFLAKIMK
jgi:glucose-1-phosphate thymidylyltransferase